MEDDTNFDLLLQKPSAAIAVSTVSGYLTLNQRKVYNSLLRDAKEELDKDSTKRVFSVSLSETLERMNISHASPDRLKKELKKIQNIQVEWNSFEKVGKGKAWGVFSLMSEIKIQRNKITYGLPDFLTNALLNLGRDNPYAYIDLNTVKSLSNPYALALYEQAEDYFKTKKIPRMTIEKYRQLIGVSETKYRTRFNQFRDNLVEAPIREVNERTRFNLEYKFIFKDGAKRPSHIDIFIKLKQDDKEVTSLDELNNDIYLVRSYLSILGYKEADALKYLDKYPLRQCLYAASQTLSTKKKGQIKTSVHKTFEYYLMQGRFNDDELEKLKKDTHSDIINNEEKNKADHVHQPETVSGVDPTFSMNNRKNAELNEFEMAKKQYDSWIESQVEILYNNMNMAEKSSYQIHALINWCKGDKGLLSVFFDEDDKPKKDNYSAFLIETGKLMTFEQWTANQDQPDMFDNMPL